MAKKNEQELAKSYYMQTDKTQKEIADIVGVGENTLGKWVKEGGWEETKETLRISNEKIIMNLYKEIQKIDDFVQKSETGFADSKMADARNKILTSIIKLEKQIALPQKVAVGVQFVEFILSKNLADGKKTDIYLGQFLNEQAKKQ